MADELGMYAMHDMKPGTVKIGEYTLCRQSEGKIWIQMDDGEGGEFTESGFPMLSRNSMTRIFDYGSVDFVDVIWPSRQRRHQINRLTVQHTERRQLWANMQTIS